MSFLSHARPELPRRVAGVLIAGALLIPSAGLLACPAAAATNASSAASFIENAQNADGGFSETRGSPSSAQASLWATVALLAAGKNPADEKLNGGSSADDYLATHLSDYRSLTDLGLLAIVQAASGAAGSRYGNPETELQTDLTAPTIRSDPGGAAMGVIGLLALRANAAAASTARTLDTLEQPDGGWGKASDTDSASTALVLEAIAQSGVGTSSDRLVSRGLAYLHAAQVNDGSIATSDRTNASSSGDVAATAFTIQALQALHHPQLRTPTGTTVLQGLASYQQLSTGGLSPFGAYDTGVAPSVTQTAQAYPAFDGVAFPLPYVAPAPQPPKSAPATTQAAVNRTSSGVKTQGISSSSPTSARTTAVSAYKGASAAGSAKAHRRTGPPVTSSSVTGTVVGATATPKLVTRAGHPPAKDYTALYLALALLAFAVVGGVAERRRPRAGTRSLAAATVQAVDRVRLAAIRRRALAPALAVLLGAGLIALPVFTGMWSRAPRGAAMIQAFTPYMQTHGLSRLSGDVGTLNAGFVEARASGPALEFPGIAKPEARFAAADPQLSQFETRWPGIDRRFTRLLTTMRRTRLGFGQISALPSFRAFPWFLLAPGVLLLALGLPGLVWPASWGRVRLGVLALGVALVIAPLALGMFGAGAGGERMLSAFRTVETRGNVTALQDDFGQLAIGQSALSELPPRVVGRLPAVRRLDARWISILNELTPTLGVMSDNVANYGAVRALPSFTAFPWLFAGPGALAILVALLAGFRGPFVPVRLRAHGTKRNLEARSSA